MVGIVLVVLLVVTGMAFRSTAIHYRAERRKVALPGGPTFDVLTHRDGFTLYSRWPMFSNTYGSVPRLAAVLERWRTGHWRWAVTVRQSPFRGYKDPLHEAFDDQESPSVALAKSRLSCGAGSAFGPRSGSSSRLGRGWAARGPETTGTDRECPALFRRSGCKWPGQANGNSGLPR